MAALAAIVVVASVGLVRDVTAAQGEIRDASCRWHGHDVVLTGIVINRTMSFHTFVVAPVFALEGRVVPDPGHWAVRVGPGGAKAWRAVDPFVQDRAGAAITACNPSVSVASSHD